METRIGRLPTAPVQSFNPTIRPDRFEGRRVAALGKAVGLTQFGVNHVTLQPGAWSALRHWHEAEDEFVYVLEGELTLVDEAGAHPLRPGEYAGFPAGAANAHHLVNRSAAPASYLVVGTRVVGRDVVHYPDDPELGVVAVVRDARGERI